TRLPFFRRCGRISLGRRESRAQVSVGEPNSIGSPSRSGQMVSLDGAYSEGGSQISWEDGERVFRRGWRRDDNGKRAVLLVMPAPDPPSRSSLDHLTHEYELKNELDGAWAVLPLDFVHHGGRTMLVLEDAGGEPLDRLLGAPMPAGRFLGVAIG